MLLCDILMSPRIFHNEDLATILYTEKYSIPILEALFLLALHLAFKFSYSVEYPLA